MGNDGYIAPDLMALNPTMLPYLEARRYAIDIKSSNAVQILDAMSHHGLLTIWLAHCADCTELLRKYPLLGLHNIIVISESYDGAIRALHDRVQFVVQRHNNTIPKLIQIEAN